MMKTKVLFLTMVCLPFMAAHAESYAYLTFQKADGTVVSIDVESLEMTLQDGKLTYTNSVGTGTLTLADLAAMYFSASDATAITPVVVDSTDGKVEVFSLKGTSYGTFSSVKAVQGSVPAGMYIVKMANGKTLKITVK